MLGRRFCVFWANQRFSLGSFCFVFAVLCQSCVSYQSSGLSNRALVIGVTHVSPQTNDYNDYTLRYMIAMFMLTCHKPHLWACLSLHHPGNF